MTQKVQGDLTFGSMLIGLTIVESVLGGYIGQIVFAFFRKE